MKQRNYRRRLFMLLPFLLVGFAVFLLGMALIPNQAQAQTGLTVKIDTAYNLVVDSNVSSPSTFAPRAATVYATFCNETLNPMTNVYGYIGDYKGGTGSTPGTYPVKTGWIIDVGGSYFFKHVGPSADASRFVGDMAPGECKVQYWSFTYPACTNNNANDSGADKAFTTPCQAPGIPTWGTSVKADDDLSLNFDVWAKADGGFADNKSWTMSMRNEISAMANKIRPNPDGSWFNTDTTTIVPGAVITTNGVLYTLGNIRQGFDNDGNFTPDYNAWLQPFGDPSYDPSCFRLIRTSTVLTVSRSAGQPNLILQTNDLNPHPVYGGPLYFSNLPPDNNGVRGEVRYTFLALNGPCTVPISPYQEVASGSDNEKFNGDYGTGIPPVVSTAPEVIISKDGPNSVAPNTTFTYNIPFHNTSATNSAGLTLSSNGINMPLVIRDQVPVGLLYLANSATSNNVNPTGCAADCYTVRYSADGGATWVNTLGDTLSTVANPVVIEWWLTNPLPAGEGGTVRFRAQVPSDYLALGGASFITNEACASFGGATSFACAEDVTMVQGTHSIGDFVWRDLNLNKQQNGGDETGIANIGLSLYWDVNGDGVLDDGDMFIAETSTNTSGFYSFPNLPTGNYLVVVDEQDPDLPSGFRHTTDTVHVVTNLNSNYQLADFGFGSTLQLTKSLISGPDRYEGRNASYTLTIQNLRVGQGEQLAGPSCVYEIWSDSVATANAPKNFTNPANVIGQPDGVYASGNYAIGAGRWIRGSGFNTGSRSGTITNVDAIVPLYLSNALVDDRLAYTLKSANGATTYNPPVPASFETAVLNTRVGIANASRLVWSGVARPTALGGGAWQWSDFANVSVEINPAKQGGSDSATLFVDAIGFRITTSGLCSAVDQSDILATVPLTDTYDTTYLEFISADPPQTSVADGLITWANVGPINPGQSRTVLVNFRIKNLPPPGNVDVPNVMNYAGVTEATFVDGGSANNSYSQAPMNIIPTGTINGVVYSDPNSSGWNYNTVPGTDFPIPGVQVFLYGCVSTAEATAGDMVSPVSPHNSDCTSSQNGLGQWTLMATQVTDANGYYEFAGLFHGFYYVQVNNAQLPGATQTAEANDNQSSVTGVLPNTTANGITCGACNYTWGPATSTSLTNGNWNPINNPGETINGVNFGYNIGAAVYGSVWEDVNGDGNKEAGEGPITPVTVRLYAADCTTLIASTTTDSSGRYAFGSLTAGTQYCIKVDTTTMPTVPGGSWTQTGENDGTVNNQITFTVAAGVMSGSHDFGFQKTGNYSLSGNVFADWNADANFNGLDTGLGGITVELRNSSEQLIATTTTNPDGSYIFPNLPNETYNVHVDPNDLPIQYRQTQDPDQAGACTICDNEGTRTISGANVTNVNFGYAPNGTGSIGDRVWRDNNGNGIQNPGEPGIPGITVRLYVEYGDGSGYVLVREAVTNSSGLYSFTNLPPGNYHVEVDTTDDDLPTDSADNPFVPTTPTTVNVALATNQTYLDADFGFAPGGVIGDTIYWDANGNADQDWNELGIPGVNVTLERWNDTTWMPYATDTTDANGNYLFTSLPAGQYRVVVNTTSAPINGRSLTGDPDTNGIPCTPDPGAPWTGYCDSEHEVEIRPGQTYLGADFGYQPTGVIGDFIWLDSSNFGVQDPGEPGLVDVRVWLCNGTPCDATTAVMTTTTDFSGYYSFVNVGAGTWTVQVDSSTLPASVIPTYDLDGKGTPHVTSVSLANAGDSNFDADFGYRYDGNPSLSGSVFYDVLRNENGGRTGGDRETGEPGYAGQTVFLWQLVGSSYVLVGSTTTNANGEYTFPNLPGNTTYRVSTNATSPILNNAEHTSSENNENNATAWEQVVLATADVTNVDFGFFIPTDFDDLPNTYQTQLSGGPYHINSGEAGTLRLGSTIDLEPNGLPGAAANGDGASDDGVQRNMSSRWTPGATIELFIEVRGGTGVVGGWFDWDGNGVFAAGEFVDFGSLNTGVNTVQVTVPASGYDTGDPLYARFRVFDPANIPGGSLTTDDYQGGATGGEVEGYYWTFSPTAVSLSSFSGGNSAITFLVLAAVGVLLAAGSLLVARRRQ